MASTASGPTVEEMSHHDGHLNVHENQRDATSTGGEEIHSLLAILCGRKFDSLSKVGIGRRGERRFEWGRTASLTFPVNSLVRMLRATGLSSAKRTWMSGATELCRFSRAILRTSSPLVGPVPLARSATSGPFSTALGELIGMTDDSTCCVAAIASLAASIASSSGLLFGSASASRIDDSVECSAATADGKSTGAGGPELTDDGTGGGRAASSAVADAGWPGDCCSVGGRMSDACPNNWFNWLEITFRVEVSGRCLEPTLKGNPFSWSAAAVEQTKSIGSVTENSVPIPSSEETSIRPGPRRFTIESQIDRPSPTPELYHE